MVLLIVRLVFSYYFSFFVVYELNPEKLCELEKIFFCTFCVIFSYSISAIAKGKKSSYIR